MSASAALCISAPVSLSANVRKNYADDEHPRSNSEACWRIDPFALPQTLQVEAEADGDSDVRYTVDRGGAVMKRTLSCGLPLSMSVPRNCFKGVVARTSQTESGETTVALELLHQDAALSVPLCLSKDLEDVAADWHAWSRRFKLPMLVEDERGVLVTVKNSGGIENRGVKQRRRRVAGVRHRPRFLQRRRTPVIGPVEILRAEEIIART